MSAIKLLTRPPWHNRTNVIRRKPYWIKYRYGNSLLVHMVPFDRVYEFDRLSQPFIHIDYRQWDIVYQQELRDYEKRMNPFTEECMSTEALVQEIDQAQPKEFSEGTKPSPKEEKEYISKGRFRKKTRIFGE